MSAELSYTIHAVEMDRAIVLLRQIWRKSDDDDAGMIISTLAHATCRIFEAVRISTDQAMREDEYVQATELVTELLTLIEQSGGHVMWTLADSVRAILAAATEHQLTT